MAETAAAPLPAPGPPAAELRFAGVVVDIQGHRLLVDGRQRACSTRAMALLQLLCQRPGQVWLRAELLDALWPGGQVVADESLSQLVFRLRAALGPYAETIATVRGVGVRLDAQPEPDDAAGRPASPASPEVATPAAGPKAMASLGAGRSPATASADAASAEDRSAATEPATASAAATPAATAVASAAGAGAGGQRGRRAPLALLAAVSLALLAWLTWPWGGAYDSGGGNRLAAADGTVLQGGFGMRRSDLSGMADAAVALVVDAFEQDRLGDRARARALMEAAHRIDTVNPVPALVLALWTAAIGAGDEADAWLADADVRLANADSPYLVLLAGYVRAERGGRLPDIVRQAGALLDLRPDAWFLRLASAHVHGAMGLRERALAELKAMPFDPLDHPRLAMALADRASFGDVAGARAILAGIRHDPDNLDLALARARIDWSAGDHVAARAGFVASAELARRQARLELRDRSLAYVGILDLLAGDDAQALPSLERARAGAAERGVGNLELDLTLLLAHVHAALGQQAAVRAELAHAAALAQRLPSSDLGYFTRLVALRLAPDLEPAAIDLAGQPGAAALVQARRALLSGDRGDALVLAERAVAQGALEARLAEETRLLLAELGQPAPAGPPLDPPHPPLTRFAIRRLADQAAAMAVAGPGQRPGARPQDGRKGADR